MPKRFLMAMIMLPLFLIFTALLGIIAMLLIKVVPFLKALWITIAVIVWLGVAVEFVKDFKYTLMWR